MGSSVPDPQIFLTDPDPWIRKPELQYCRDPNPDPGYQLRTDPQDPIRSVTIKKKKMVKCRSVF
jgi:hypothetical protein